MAMPRPSGEAQEIAEKVVPGLYRNRERSNESSEEESRGSLSEVEIMQTKNIENKEGLKVNPKKI